MSKDKGINSQGKIAVIGDRELILGYRLLGIENTFLVTEKNEASRKMEELLLSHDYNLVIASQIVLDALSSVTKAKVESSIDPLVIFMPSLSGNMQEESLAALAKRVLGISIKTG
ncbi:MAG TPA: V-type ATP synthase subunit F [Candidatus Saccharimonadales bacterium]|jgi:V/A-type H+-transporting ATPase subunit F|nr:V-type ATP synthase subunit F [Candidatus Saccharimonadales bacterium]